MGRVRKILGLVAVVGIAGFVWGTVCPLVTTKLFWVRLFDFPRLQLAGIGVVAGLLLAVARWPRGRVRLVLALLLLVGLSWQAVRIYPFTPLAAVQVPRAAATLSGERLKLYTCNILQHNRQRHLLLEQIAREQPDLVLLMEVDAAWMDALEPLRRDYPHRIEHPLENTWGIALYSKLELDGEDVHYFASRERPAVRAIVTLPSGRQVLFLGLHPAPPGYERPDGERVSSAPRDHTLTLAAREAAAYEGPVLVAGDFNDAAWSRMTRQFQEISGLLDPRVGRGMFNTYDANSALLRYPIDHVFLSRDFQLIEMRRLSHVGSDHFPMFVEVVLPTSP